VKSIRLGSGAGYAGDRWEPAAELVERGRLDYLCFETLAERTIALGQLEKLSDPGKGYNPWLRERLAAVLPAARAQGTRIVTNMGAANPAAAAQAALDVARELGLSGFQVAVVLGDDVTGLVRRLDLTMQETGERVSTLGDALISGNAYLGADVIVSALETGADLVITGRVADPSLFVGCMLHGLRWRYDDYSRLGQATVIGHLLECAAQVTGGYFADPGYKDVPDIERLGFPLAEVNEAGEAFVSKAEGSGGCVTLATCKEQLVYEIHDPEAYITPDCVADFSGVRFAELGADCIAVSGARARPRTPTLKASVGYRAGFIGEGHVGYAGPGAAARARLAGDIVRKRLSARGIPIDELRVDLIGISAIHGEASRPVAGDPYEVRLRVAGRCAQREHAAAIGLEVQTLLCNGPSGGSGDFMQVRELIGMRSVLLPRDEVHTRVEILE
jgi:hypothetical protein